MDNKKENEAKKTATNNQWTNTAEDRPNDKTERKDGPGGEDAE